MSLARRGAHGTVTASTPLHFSCGFLESRHSGLPGEVNRKAYGSVSEPLFLRLSEPQAAWLRLPEVMTLALYSSWSDKRTTHFTRHTASEPSVLT